MATSTYTLVNSTTLTTGTSSVTFSSLPAAGTYQDLILKIDGNFPSAIYPKVRLNSDSGTNYQYSEISANRFSTNPAGDKSETYTEIVTSVAYGLKLKNFSELTIFDYAMTDRNKTLLCKAMSDPNEGTGISQTSWRWRSNSAISSIYIFGGSYPTGTVFELWGIKA